MNNPVIICKNVTKTFSLQEDKTFKEFLPSLIQGKPWAKQFVALDNISFEVEKGETLGVVGKNGSGKSTLLKLIAGVTTPTKGEIIIKEKVAPLIEVGTGFHHELTGLENIYLSAAVLGLHKKEIEQVLDKIIEFSELKDFMHVPVKRYSSGMYMRLGFSVAIYVNTPILLIDEVLSVGDASFQKKCMNYFNSIRKSGEKTILFISHSEEAVKQLCDRAILLSAGNIVAKGDPKEVFKKYHTLY